MEFLISGSALNHLLDRLAPLRQKRRRFLLAALLVAIALALTVSAQLLLGSVTAFVFAAAVVVSTSLFGFWAGLIAATMAGLLFDFFYIPPIFHFTLDGMSWRVAASLTLLAAVTHLVERRISARIRSRKKPPTVGVLGSLDGLEPDGDLLGWALDADHLERPVVVTLFADNRALANVAAVHYRPDVAAGMNCTGCHGYYIELSQYLRPGTEALIDVRLENGTPLAGSPQLVKVPPRTRPERPTILFMHIPKTAGTAFREAIAANFNQSEIGYLYPTPPGFLVSDLRQLPLDQRRALRMVIGHYQFGMHEALPQESQYITIVREPAQRVWSQYRYTLQTQPELVERDGRVLSLAEVFEQRLSVDLDNCLVRCFSGVDERDFPPGHLTLEIYNDAVRNLRSAFAYVGHQESSAAAYADLQRQFGWYALPELQAVNPGTVRSSEGVAPEALEVIRHYNRFDYLLYAEIQDLFPPRPGATRVAAPQSD